MATINLGSIKFRWQGAYNGATAYSVDDVVSYNGSSYICKLASTGNLPTNTTYFDQMSSAGTNGTNGTDGTDVGTIITTQGDLLYRDGSGLQRLGAGTSGQVLQTGGAGANPSWGTVSSDFVLLAAVDSRSTTVSEISIDGYFSSEYKYYKFIGEIYGEPTGEQIGLRFNQSGTSVAGGSYNSASLYTYNNSAPTYNGRSNNDNFLIAGPSSDASGGSYPYIFEIDIADPLDTTTYKFFKAHSIYKQSSAPVVEVSGGYWVGNQNALSGITFIGDNGYTIRGKAHLYGIKGTY